MNAHHIAHHPGLLRAYHSSVIHFPLSGMEKEFGFVGESHKNKVFLAWGLKDTVVPFSCASLIQSLIPSAKLVTHPDAGHSIPMEYPEFLAQEIAYFLH